MTAPPIVFAWNGEAMIPFTTAWLRVCQKNFQVGLNYRMVPYEERSSASHRHFFACINSAWQSLPEKLAPRFPTPDHLRKWCLIKAGWRDEDVIVLDSDTDATAVAAYVKRSAARNDAYAIVSVSGNVVTTYTARSQKMQAQSRKEFQEIKDKVLQILSEMVGTDVAALNAEGDRLSEPQEEETAPLKEIEHDPETGEIADEVELPAEMIVGGLLQTLEGIDDEKQYHYWKSEAWPIVKDMPEELRQKVIDAATAKKATLGIAP